MTAPRPAAGDPSPEALPTNDAFLLDPDLDLDGLAAHWAARSALRPMTAEEMRGADRRAQRLGVSGDSLMEEAGSAVGAAARAVIGALGSDPRPTALVLCGSGNNGGDGFVAARWLAARGVRVVAVLVAPEPRPSTHDAARNWDRAAATEGVELLHAPTVRDVSLFVNGIERAAVALDALLGTGVRGSLREPIRSAVDLLVRARRLGVPVVAADTPTALDLTSGMPSDPVVRADVTVTFHRPKHGLLTRTGRVLAGRVLVAPIGIPWAADPV